MGLDAVGHTKAGDLWQSADANEEMSYCIKERRRHGVVGKEEEKKKKKEDRSSPFQRDPLISIFSI